jgi:8-oxo-dGTP pyrophosphatase MutT (NUDIX family)
MTHYTQTSPWRRTSSRPIYENPWFRVREDRVIRPDGSEGVYGVVELPEYAGIVAVNDHGQVAMVRQWRYLYNEPSLETSAGCAAPEDATPLDTARRELLEETGLTASTWTSLGQIRYSAVTNVGHLFLARNLAIATERPASEDDWTSRRRSRSVCSRTGYRYASGSSIATSSSAASSARASPAS